MKKTVKALFLVVCALAFGMGRNAFAALPTIDGAVSPATEWANNSYTYYLDVTDPNEAGITDNYDIKHVVLFQEYNGLAIPDADDGIYLLIETYATPTLVDAQPGDPGAAISMNADFNGDGFIDLIIRHDADLGPEALSWRRPVGSILGAPTAFTAFGTEGVNFKRGSVLEYFIPSTTGGTPHAPFPGSFIGTIVYDNGGDEPDDRVTGSLNVPEPGTFFLLGSGLLGLLGVGKFGKK